MSSKKCLLCRSSTSCTFISVHANIGSGKTVQDVIKRVFPLDILHEVPSIEEICFKCSFHVTLTRLLLRSCDTFGGKSRSLGRTCLLCDEIETSSFETCFYPGNKFFDALLDYLQIEDLFTASIKLCYKCRYHLEGYIELKTLICINFGDKCFNKDDFSSEQNIIIRSTAMKRKGVRGRKRKSSTGALHKIFHHTNTKVVPSSTGGFSQKMRSLSVLVRDIRKDNSLQIQLGLENNGHDVWRFSPSRLRSATRCHMQKRTRNGTVTQEDPEVKLIKTSKRRVKQVLTNNKNPSASTMGKIVTRSGGKRKSMQSESSSVIEVISDEVMGENVVDTRDESGSDFNAMVSTVSPRAGRGRVKVGAKRTNESVASIQVSIKKENGSRLKTRVQEKSPIKSKSGSVGGRDNMTAREQRSVTVVSSVPVKQRKVSREPSIAEGVRKSPRKLASSPTLGSSGEKDVNSRLHAKGDIKVVESEGLLGSTILKRNSGNKLKELENVNDGKVQNLRNKRKSGKLIVGSVDEITPEKDQVQMGKAVADDDVIPQRESGRTREVKSTKQSSFRRREVQVEKEVLVEAKEVQNVDINLITVEVPEMRMPRKRSKKIQIEWCSFCGIQLDSVDNRLEHEFSHQEPRQLHVSLHRCNLHGPSVKLPVYVNLEEVAALKSPQEDNCTSNGNDTRPPLNVENVLNEDEYNAYDDVSDSEEENLDSLTPESSQENNTPQTLNDSETKETSAVVLNEGEKKSSSASNTKRAKKKGHVKMRLWENVTPRTTRCGRVVKVTRKYEEHTLRSAKPCHLESKFGSNPSMGDDILDSVVSSPSEENVDDYVEVIFPKDNLEKVIDTNEFPKNDLDASVFCKVKLEVSQDMSSDLLSEMPERVCASEDKVDKTSSCVEINVAGDIVNDEVPQILEEEKPRVNDALDDDEVASEPKVLELETDDARDVSVDSDEIGNVVDPIVTTDLEVISENLESKSKEDSNEVEITHVQGISENLMDVETDQVGNCSDELENPQEEDVMDNLDADVNDNDEDGLKCMDLEDSLENVDTKTNKDVGLQNAILGEDSESMNLTLNEVENDVDEHEDNSKENGLEDISDGEFEYGEDEEMVDKVDENLNGGRDEAENDGGIEFQMALDSVEAVFAEESRDKPESVEIASISDVSEDAKDIESDKEGSKEVAGGEMGVIMQEREILGGKDDAQVECLESSENIAGCEDVNDKDDVFEEVEALENSAKDEGREGLDTELGESEDITLVDTEMADGVCEGILERETKSNEDKDDDGIGYTAEETESSGNVTEEANKSPSLDEPSPVDKLDSVMLGNETECSISDKQCEGLIEDASGSSNNANGLINDGIDGNEGYDSCAINGISDVINESLPFEDVSVVRSIDRYEDGKDKTIIECEAVRDFDDEKATMVCCK